MSLSLGRSLRVACAGAGVATALGVSAPLHAQDGPTLITQGISAYDDFDSERALGLLRRGVNPAAGPQDSLWAYGVQLLAQILSDEGQQPLMSVWARWAMRLAPGMWLDTENIVIGSEVIGAFEGARGATAPGPGDAVTRTAFRWPAGDPGTGSGRLEVTQPGVPVPVNVLVVGSGVVTPGQGITLAAGTYEIQASATGYRPAQVTREVVPGVTTVLTFDLQPAAVVAEGTLDEGIRSAAMRQVVSISAHRFGVDAPSCGAGAFVGRDGLLLTTYRNIRGADSLVVNLGARRITDVQVASYDVARDLAVLKVPLIRGDSLPVATQITDDQYAWGFGFPNCGAPADQRLRVASWENRPDGPVTLRDSLADAMVGSPLIDRDGAVVGMWRDGLSVIPAPRTQDVIADARRGVTGQQLLALAEVGDRENHAYGSVAITSTVTAAVVRITPLEDWHWPELTQTAFAPVTFAGPAGRYQVNLTVNGELRNQVEFTLRPSVADRLSVDAREAAGPVAAVEPQQEGGGGFPWIIAVLGGGAAAAAAALLAGGGGNGPVTETTGSIVIRFPDP